MKNLHIVRHSKSTWELNVSDIDRPLNEKGITNSYAIAERFRKLFPKPELLISSPACRALHTAVIFSRVAGVSEKNILLSQSIYSANCSELFRIIEEVPNEIDNIMLFGHNNTFTDFVNLFLKNKIDNLPTTGIASFTFETPNWQIKEAIPVKTNIDFPKNDKFAD